MSNDVETKLSAARTRLILDKPFLGALVLRLPMVVGDPQWCKTTAIDAKTLYYNHAYIDTLSLEQTQFVLAHEAMHCALSHFARRQHRDKRRWDVACDFAINPMLVADGLVPIPEALLQKTYEGMTAEEIYPCIKENPDQQPMDQHLYDDSANGNAQGKRPPGSPPAGAGRGQEPPPPDQGNGYGTETKQSYGAGASQPPPLNENERETLRNKWQQRLAGAAQQAMRAGKLSGTMARLVDHLLQPQLPWRMLLARYLTGIARDDYSLTSPSNRREGEAILPSLRSTQTDLIITVDTSGSLGDREIGEFLSEINAIKGQLRARITLLACDAELAEDAPWVYESWEELTLPGELQGGGGTSFKPAFDWVDAQDRRPDVMLYFTDAEGEFPKQEPGYPVVWLVKGKADVPWGQRIQLN